MSCRFTPKWEFRFCECQSMAVVDSTIAMKDVIRDWSCKVWFLEQTTVTLQNSTVHDLVYIPIHWCSM